MINNITSKFKPLIIDALLTKTIKISLIITISIVLFSHNASSFIFIAYAQTQSGPATSGNAIGSGATSGPATSGNAIGSGATSGPATSGNVTSGGGNLTSSSPSVSHKPPVSPSG